MNIAKAFKKNKLLFIALLAYIILIIAMPSKALDAGKTSMYYVVEMIQIMPVIFILTSLIEAWVPREAIMKGFGENSGIRGSILSFILGSFSAGPIYAAFPVCKMLLKKGASISNIVIILSAWAVVKVPMLANEAKFLGPKFMAIRWVLTTIAIFIMAYVTSKLVDKDSIPMEDEQVGEGANTLDVKEEYCIGCSVCSKLCPDTFELVDGKAKAIQEEIAPDKKESIDNIIQKCPTKAIYLRQSKNKKPNMSS